MALENILVEDDFLVQYILSPYQLCWWVSVQVLARTWS